MISYIFKNKTKNILAASFTVLYLLNTNLIYRFFSYINYGYGEFLLLAEVVLNLLPYIFIVVYLCTLKMQYMFKDWLFPAAFAIFLAKCIYTIIDTLTGYTDYIDSFDDVLWITGILVTDIVFLAAYTLCFFGSIKNFKNVSLLRIGIIVLITSVLIFQVAQIVIAYKNHNISLILKENFVIMMRSVLEIIYDFLIQLLFYFGIFNLTLNKKSEYIDITPFVEARKAKKEAKRAAKAEEKQREEARLNAPAPEIPDGCWRCMACGKILPDDTLRCECGYKKQ